MSRTGRPLGFKPASTLDTSMPSSDLRLVVDDTTAGHEFRPAVNAVTSAPQTVTIQALSNGRVLVQPLYVRVEQFGDEWLATSFDLSLVGRGETEFDALDHLREQIGDLFEALSELRETLGPQPRLQLQFLERLAGLQTH